MIKFPFHNLVCQLRSVVNMTKVVHLQMNVGIPLYTFEHVGTISFVKANTVVQRRNDVEDVWLCCSYCHVY